VLKDTLKGEILDAIRDLMSLGETPTTTRIAMHLGKDKGNVSRELANLVATGKVIRGEKQGREQPYWLPAANGPEEG
jgi:predicted transcriptional regulator